MAMAKRFVLRRVTGRVHTAGTCIRLPASQGGARLFFFSDFPKTMLRQPALIARGQYIMQKVRAHLLHDDKAPIPARTVLKKCCALLPAEAMLSICEGYDVISFDLFDTLLFRTVGSAENTFRLLEMQRGQTGFAKERGLAEREARKTAPHGEATLADIYRVLKERGIVEDAQSAMAAEMAMEGRVLTPVSGMRELLAQLRARGKRLVITSDMYLSAEALGGYLSDAGFQPFERIFVSCETGCGKADGRLLRRVAEELGTRSILHIGDNLFADVIGAAQAGLDGAYIGNRQQLGLLGDVDFPPSMASAVTQGLIRNRFALDGRVDKAFLAGYAVGGPLIYAACRWIKEQAEMRRWDRLFFASRDGYPLWLAYTRFFGDASYLKISRAAVQKLCIQESINTFVDHNFIPRVKKGETVGAVMTSLDLAACMEKWKGELPPDTPIDSACIERLRGLMLRDKDAVEACFSAVKADALDYLMPQMKDCRRAAVVDTGWNGTSIATLRRFLQKAGCTVELDSALLGTSRSKEVQCQIDSGRMLSFLYSPTSHRDMLARQFRMNTTICCTVMELLFSTDQPPLISYRKREDGGLTYGEADPQLEELTHRQQAGMMAFCEDYHSAVTRLGMELPMMPEDAYALFDRLTRDTRLLEEIYGEVCHAATPTQTRPKTFSEMLRDAHWSRQESKRKH